MHQTTVRFGADLWRELVDESERAGVSVAQYVREAAVARLARGGTVADVDAARRRSADVVDSSSAVLAQSELAQARAQRLRADAHASRAPA